MGRRGIGTIVRERCRVGCGLRQKRTHAIGQQLVAVGVEMQPIFYEQLFPRLAIGK